MITKDYILERGIKPESYLEKIDKQYKEKWERKLKQVEFTSEQLELLEQNLPIVNITVFSADWCGDCQNGVPILIKIAEKNSNIKLHIIDRDPNQDMLGNYKTAGGKKVPLVFFMDKEFNEITRWVERSTFAYDVRYQAKLEAIRNNSDDYTTYLRPLLKENSQKMFNENVREIIELLKRTVTIIRAISSLDELKTN